MDCGCPRVRGRGHWTDGNADGEKTDLSQVQKRSSGSGLATYRGRVDEGKTWTRVSQHQGRPAASPRYRRVGLLLAGYLMQCHEAQQAPNHHRREEGRRTSNIPGTCQSGILSGLASTQPLSLTCPRKDAAYAESGGAPGRSQSFLDSPMARRCCPRSFGSEMQRSATRWQGRIPGWACGRRPWRNSTGGNGPSCGTRMSR